MNFRMAISLIFIPLLLVVPTANSEEIASPGRQFKATCTKTCQNRFAQCQIDTKGTKESYCRRKLRSCADRCTERSSKRRLQDTSDSTPPVQRVKVTDEPQ